VGHHPSEDPCATRKRKASFDSVGSSDELEEINEIADTEEPEWKHEEDYLGEDDDEWLDSHTGLNSVSADAKIPRKKAPSGSACEKHKRWKKRCPEDCPMRKQKSKKSSDNAVDMDSDSSRETSPCSTPSPPLSRRYKKGMETETVTIIRLSAYQMRVAPGNGFPKLCAPLPEDTQKSVTRAPSSEQSPKRVKRLTTTRNSPVSSCDDLSSVEDEPLKENISSPPDIKPVHGSPKPKKTRNPLKSRSGRKYLPQACESHKLLHAKCPASCSERLKRDAEITQQQLPHSSSSEDITSSF